MPTEAISRESMRQAGELIQQRVVEYKNQARSHFYAVMLFQRECPSCGMATLAIKEDSHCQCRNCGAEFDPTLKLQTCPDCDHALVLKVYHYWCPQCRKPVHSMFCFGERVFNNKYFREMMQESRERRKEEVEKLRKLLNEARSPPYWPDTHPVLPDAAQFAQDLNKFLGETVVPKTSAPQPRPFYDMKAYRHHLLERAQGCVVEFDGVSALLNDARLDRVYRFITAIFLENEGLLVLEQRLDGRIRMVGT